MGKGDTYRSVDKRRYDENFDMIKWNIKTPDNESITAHEVGIKKEYINCNICNLPISVYELTTFNKDGVCHSGCVFAPGRDK